MYIYKKSRISYTLYIYIYTHNFKILYTVYIYCIYSSKYNIIYIGTILKWRTQNTSKTCQKDVFLNLDYLNRNRNRNFKIKSRPNEHMASRFIPSEWQSKKKLHNLLNFVWRSRPLITKFSEFCNFFFGLSLWW